MSPIFSIATGCTRFVSKPSLKIMEVSESIDHELNEAV